VGGDQEAPDAAGSDHGNASDEDRAIDGEMRL